MEETYDHKKHEKDVMDFWDKNVSFSPKIEPDTTPQSMFLVPPNASGPMHVGNALMIALQDILARHFRNQGKPTLWVPGTDHGGYETEITFERELERRGVQKNNINKKDLFNEISSFVLKNNNLIKDQVKQLGASVDWSRFRYSMDNLFLKEVNCIFNQMIEEKLICKKHAMNYFCSACSTILSDIELKEKNDTPHYFIKFSLKENKEETIDVAIKYPEFISTISHILIHPNNKKYSYLIGKQVLNPFNNNIIEILSSKRKFDYERERFITPLFQDLIKYDYEYAVMHDIPVSNKNLIDWDGNMIEIFPGKKPLEARKIILEDLKQKDLIQKIEHLVVNPDLICKKGHQTQTITALAWFLNLDKHGQSLKKATLDELEKNPINIYPRSRKNEIFRWIDLMKFWPIGRQNTWGIKIPIWYDISNPSDFSIWFIDKNNKQHHGNLDTFLKNGFTLEEIETGLEKIYTASDKNWVLEKKEGIAYLPETDIFDSWFSGIWSALVFGRINSPEVNYFYPNHSLIIGHDLVRLCVSREIVINYYLTKKIPFRNVYFHGLIKGSDGQKMSKSIGNVVSLDYYLEKFGADVTRLTLVSYVDYDRDFMIEEERLIYFQEFTARLWRMGRIVEIANKFSTDFPNTISDKTSGEISQLIEDISRDIKKQIENFLFAKSQEKIVNLLSEIENLADSINSKENKEEMLAIFKYIFKKYIKLLHPFAPFITEDLNTKLFPKDDPLSTIKN